MLGILLGMIGILLRRKVRNINGKKGKAYLCGKEGLEYQWEGR